MGYAFSRAICITVGFLHPAYRHYKHIKAKSEADSLSEESKEISKNFDQHWITMAAFSVAEVLTDYLLFWIPFYNELKILLVIWISLPFTKGSEVIYRIYLYPNLLKYERQIDGQILKFDQKVKDFIYSKSENFKNNLLEFIVQRNDISPATATAGSSTTVNDELYPVDSPNTAEEKRKQRRAKKNKTTTEIETFSSQISKTLPAISNISSSTRQQQHSRSESNPVPKKDPLIACHQRKASSSIRGAFVGGLYQMKTYGKTKDINYKKLLIGQDPIPCNKTEIEKMQEFSNYFKHPITTETPNFISTKAAKKKAKNSNSKPILQSVLNIGQKRIVQKCKDCLMEYNLFNMDDLSLHKKYHASVINALHWNSKDLELVEAEGIVYIRPPNNQNGKTWKRISEILKFVNHQLGAAQQELSELSDCHGVVYISDQKVVGFVLCRQITKSFRVIPSSSKQNSLLDCMSNVSYDKEHPQSTAICGISRIWTAANYRKKGIATKILDSVRARFLFGGPLSTNELAFSQPTDMGQKLALSYFGRPDYLVYIED